MPPLPRETVKARATRLRAAGDAALSRHLDRQIGREVSARVETPGLARAEDFTAITFDGPAAPGEIVRLGIDRHDGRRAYARRVDL
jgi:threonylcarbamoyladenosine tRNA methylthiotransferase MtaB